MNRVVILGRGGAGKSTTAIQPELPVIELDKYFWQPGLSPTPTDEWRQIQQKLVARSRWIIDGDLGSYDLLDIRLKAADTVLILDFSLILCLIRAIRRSREQLDFWWWLISWRQLSRPKIMKAINNYASKANIYIFRSPKALDQFMDNLKL